MGRKDPTPQEEDHTVTGDANTDESGIVTKISPRSVADTVARFTGMLGVKGVKVFAAINPLTDALVAP